MTVPSSSPKIANFLSTTLNELSGYTTMSLHEKRHKSTAFLFKNYYLYFRRNTISFSSRKRNANKTLK